MFVQPHLSSLLHADVNVTLERWTMSSPVPRGPNTWGNIVSWRREFVVRKGGRAPEQAGMHLWTAAPAQCAILVNRFNTLGNL